MVDAVKAHRNQEKKKESGDCEWRICPYCGSHSNDLGAHWACFCPFPTEEEMAQLVASMLDKQDSRSHKSTKPRC